MFAILSLFALYPLFWGLFEQAGGSRNLFTDRYVDRGAVPASVFQSINPIYIILFAPLFAALWQWLGQRGMVPSAPAQSAQALPPMRRNTLLVVCVAQACVADVMPPVLIASLLSLSLPTREMR